MIKPIQTCYMCDSPKTSDEHAPPRGLFPKPGDSSGIDMRKNLITVPSCDIHNSEKSRDDEYLMYVLVFGIQNNLTATNQVKTKIARALAKNSGIAKLLAQKNIPVHVEDASTGMLQESVALKIDHSRVEQSLDHIGRAIYFHHYRAKWMGGIQCTILFLLDIGHESSQAHNASLALLGEYGEQLLANESSYGENPEVFTYKTIKTEGATAVVMLLSFYEGSKAVLLFKN